MGCFTTSEEDSGKRKSQELDKSISKSMQQFQEAMKLLLLGTGEAGKTTIIKQMKILHISGFSESERLEKRHDIRQNIQESIYDLVLHMELIDPPEELDSEENEASAAYILSMGLQEPQEYTQEYFEHVETLWMDNGIRNCYRRSNEYQLIDSAKYFLDKVQEVRQPDYVPSDQDILHCRKKTCGIQKIEFTVKVPKKFGGGSQLFWMFDVGGQRSERRKWIKVFSGIQAILFLVASSDFDQNLRESGDTNRLEEAVTLFQNVWNSRFLEDSGFILFLNKQDTLKEKVESGKNIGDYFPEYKDFNLHSKDGDEFDEYTRTKCFIRDMFLNITKRHQASLTPARMSVGRGVSVMVAPKNENRECFYHFTVATDSDNIKRVFSDVHSMVITINLSQIGLQ